MSKSKLIMLIIVSVVFGVYDAKGAKAQQIIDGVPVEAGKPLQSKDPAVLRVVDLLTKCPPWCEFNPYVKVPTERILSCFAEIAKEKTETIREAERVYVKPYWSLPDAMDDMRQQGKIFVLNKYIFNVPASVPYDDRFAFGGWRGVPATKTTYDTLWPLSDDGHGRLTITGRYSGYSGMSYNFLAEFDCFNKIYGRRKVRKAGSQTQ